MIKPMLACKQPAHMSQEEYLSIIEKHLPLLVQPKEDGFRCIINEKQFPRSRTDKPIPNKWIKKCLKDLNLPYGFDGELVTVNDKGRDCFNDIQSKVSSESGTPNFYYMVFDWFGQEVYQDRYDRIDRFLHLDGVEGQYAGVDIIKSRLCTTINEVKQYFQLYTERLGYEGICLRSPSSRYKQGRATLHNGSLFALTPWDTSEGEVVGFEEALEGLNDRGKDCLGSLIVRDSKFILDFNVGSGFTKLQRMEIWDKKNLFLGKTVSYKYKGNRTTKDRPISPIFKGWRQLIDL
jgi:ATP-dependent DNA ligase